MRLSNREKKIVDFVVGAGETNLDEIADCIWPAKKASSWRTELAKLMRHIIAKTQNHEIKIVRTSSLGRSRKAVYSSIKSSNDGGNS